MSENIDKAAATQRSDRWILFQLFDCVLERWSPVYCGASEVAIDLEIKDMLKKYPNRPIVRIFVAELKGSEIFPKASEPKEYSEVTDENNG